MRAGVICVDAPGAKESIIESSDFVGGHYEEDGFWGVEVNYDVWSSAGSPNGHKPNFLRNDRSKTMMRSELYPYVLLTHNRSAPDDIPD